MTRTTIGWRLNPLLVVAGLCGATALRAQDECDAQVARASNEFDMSRRLELLVSAVNPTACPPRGAWPFGVQLLAQTLIEDGQDSVASVWMRWALRSISPSLQVDTVNFLPKLITAFQTARAFVARTRSPGDSVVQTTWLWPERRSAEAVGRLQVTAATLPTGQLQATVETAGGVRSIQPGAPVSLPPGSFAIRAMASGYDSARVVREVLPGVTTLVDFQLRAIPAQVAGPQPVAPPSVPARPVVVAPKKKGPPWLLIGLGAAAVAGGLLALLPDGPPPPTTGSITITFPP